jgi:hypothetical protein
MGCKTTCTTPHQFFGHKYEIVSPHPGKRQNKQPIRNGWGGTVLLCTMDVAYTLFKRENPTVLEPFIVETDYERHLKRKMSCLEDKVKDLERQLALRSEAVNNTILDEKKKIQI